MSYIQWDSEIYSVGIPKIDEQHKVLVQLINSIAVNFENSDQEFINKIINTLIDYAKNHFRDEETLMRNVGFQQYADHKKHHLNFEKNISKALENYHHDGDKKAMLDKILTYLKEWLTSHILVEDQEYRKHIFQGLE